MSQFDVRGPKRIQEAFLKANAENRAAFIPFITAGFPSPEKFLQIAAQLLEYADILEVGLPYSDPLGDGPTIQKASEQALAGGTSTRRTLELVRKLRKTHRQPIVIMTYVNPIYAVGPEQFMRLAAEAGVDGLILPDLPPDQDIEIADLAARYNLAVTFLIAPTSTPKRVELVAKACTGFLYAVSVTGVTGSREASALHEVPQMLQLARQYAEVPVAVGFGIRNATTAAQLAKIADGIVVGSAFIQAIQNKQDVSVIAAEITKGCAFTDIKDPPIKQDVDVLENLKEG